MPAKRNGRRAKRHVIETSRPEPAEDSCNANSAEVQHTSYVPRSPTPPPPVDETSVASPHVSLGSSRPPANRRMRSQLPEPPTQEMVMESDLSEDEKEQPVYPHLKKRLLSTCSSITRRPVKSSTPRKVTPKKPTPKKGTPKRGTPKTRTPKTPTPKKAGRFYNALKKLTTEEEDRLREMIRDAEYIYKKEGEGYANRDKKKDFWDKCDIEFFESVFGSSLKWYRNKRSVFGKLQTKEKYKKSGSGAKVNHEQQKILEEWRFLSRHMDPIEYRCGVNLRKARDARYGVSSTGNDGDMLERVSEDDHDDLRSRKLHLLNKKNDISKLLISQTDECQHHGDYMAIMMRNMAPDLRSEFLLESLQLALNFQRRGLRTSQVKHAQPSLSEPSIVRSQSQPLPSNQGSISQPSSSFGSQMQQDRYLAQQVADSNPPLTCVPQDQMWMQNCVFLIHNRTTVNYSYFLSFK